MSQNEYATWNGHDVYTIKIVGSGQFVKERVDTLVLDFEEAKFGDSGELWDEDQNIIEDEEEVEGEINFEVDYL